MHHHRSLILTAAIAFVTATSPLGFAASDGHIEALMLDRGPFWSAVARGIQAQPGEVHVTLPPVVSAAVQSRYLQNFADQGARVVFFDPFWPAPTAAAVSALVHRGTRLVVLDNELPDNLPHIYVGHDKPRMIQEASARFAAAIGEGDEVAILRQPNQSRFTDREQQAIAAVRAAHPTATIHLDIFGADDPDLAVRQATLLLEKHPATRAILTTSTPLSLAMLKALRASGHAGSIRLIAYGVALPAEISAALADGSLSLWVAQNPFELGRRAGTVAADLVAGKNVPAKNYVDAVFVTKENLHDPAVEALSR